MTRIILEPKNKKDVLLIKELAERLNINCYRQSIYFVGNAKNYCKYMETRKIK
ncbi:MAG: hypothetical protein K8H86_00950 [Ignavibacteriaceae bacterium]|nr:hypothetical protein [Ignavibacteriaceae bacterium]